MLTNEDLLKIGLALNHIAMVSDDAQLAKIKTWLDQIEQTVLEASKRNT